MTCEIISYCDEAFILCTYFKNIMSLQIFMFIVLYLLKTFSYITGIHYILKFLHQFVFINIRLWVIQLHK